MLKKSVLILSLSLALVPSCNSDARTLAKVRSLEGAARVKHYRTGEWEKLSVGDPVFVNDTVQTKAQARVLLVTKLKDSITIGQSSLICLADSSTDPDWRQTTLHLTRGEVLLSVNKLDDDEHFCVKTPASVATVRGTKFIVSHISDQRTSNVHVLEGNVQVQSRFTYTTPIVLRPGFYTIIRHKKDPISPVRISKKHLVQYVVVLGPQYPFWCNHFVVVNTHPRPRPDDDWEDEDDWDDEGDGDNWDNNVDVNVNVVHPHHHPRPHVSGSVNIQVTPPPLPPPPPHKVHVQVNGPFVPVPPFIAPPPPRPRVHPPVLVPVPPRPNGNVVIQGNIKPRKVVIQPLLPRPRKRND